MSKTTLSSSAFAFVVAIGILNLFGDVTYEGGAQLASIPVFLVAWRARSKSER